MIPSWLVIGAVTFGVALLGGAIRPQDAKWFRRLRRPRWLTFEAAIPVIWTVIFICGAWSAYIIWEQQPGSLRTWLLMGGYLLLEMVTCSYTAVMLRTRSLRVGTLIGGTGTVLAILLAIAVAFFSLWATLLLVPYLLWSPIGTFTTWQMMHLNPEDVR